MAAKTVRHEIILDEGEPFFVLRGNSPLSPQLTQIFAACAKLIGGVHPEKIKQAQEVAAAMRAYLGAHNREEFPVLAAIESTLVHDETDSTTTEEIH